MRFEEAHAWCVGDQLALARHWLILPRAAHSKRHTLQILTTTTIARIEPSNLCDAL